MQRSEVAAGIEQVVAEHEILCYCFGETEACESRRLESIEAYLFKVALVRRLFSCRRNVLRKERDRLERRRISERIVIYKRNACGNFYAGQRSIAECS